MQHSNIILKKFYSFITSLPLAEFYNLEIRKEKMQFKPYTYM
jgi:hypothetical protein